MSDKISQKKAVIDATVKVLGEKYSNKIPVTDSLSKSQVLEIRNEIFAGIRADEIVFNKEFDDEALKRYVSSMVSNHFRKARELNGGSLPTPKTPGVSKKIKDDQLAALKLMLSKFEESSDEWYKIKDAIIAREQELLKSKQAIKIKKNKYDIDITVLPSELRQVLNA